MLPKKKIASIKWIPAGDHIGDAFMKTGVAQHEVMIHIAGLKNAFNTFANND